MNKSFSISFPKLLICLVATLVGCNNGNTQNNKTDYTNDKPAQESKNAIENAGAAKMPSGSISFKVDNTTYSAATNTVQCMYVGMGNPSMAQGMISGRGSGCEVTGIFMTAAKLGTYTGDKITSPVSMRIKVNGIEYQSSLGGDVSITVDKIRQDGNNHYIGGSFYGTFKSVDGKSIKVTDGKFYSNHL